MNGLTTLAPFSPSGVGFFLLMTVLVLTAWSKRRHLFVMALLGSGLLLVMTWAKPLELLALSFFILLPYPVILARWAKGQTAGEIFIIITLIAQMIMFMIVKQYPWLDVPGWLDHPIFLVGVSYILFRQIHLLVDAPFFRDSRLDLPHYLAFLLSPWTLIAGPIQNFDDFKRGLAQVSRPNNDVVLACSHRIVNGLIKAFDPDPE